MTPERLGRAIGHAVFLVAERALWTGVGAAIVAIPAALVFAALGIFSPASSSAARIACAVTIAFLTAVYWGALGFSVANLRTRRCDRIAPSSVRRRR